MSEKIGITTSHTTVYNCDICEKRLRHIARCHICHRDLCDTHVIYDPRDPGDYPNQFCYRCWDAGDAFRAREAAELARHDNILGQIEQEWRNVALALLPPKL